MRRHKVSVKERDIRVRRFLIACAVTLVIIGAVEIYVLHVASRARSYDARTEASEETGVGEHAPYVIDDEMVYVNNQLCAVSHSALLKHEVGKYSSRVEYDGDYPLFKGKTLIFNQCCEKCVNAFPEKWKRERDHVLRYHGLIP